MPRLPSLSGREIVRALERLGFGRAGQTGSHVKLRRGGVICIVPLHDEVKRGTLAGVLRQAQIAPDQLLEAIKQ